jgi:hypothetical protein
MPSHETAAAEAEHVETWRTISAPESEDVDALCLLVELWADRCSIAFDRGRFEFCTRYSPTDEQEVRMHRYTTRIIAMLPWFAPMRRAPQPDSREFYTHVAFERPYPTGFIAGWH